jgi:hypothetical protein
MDVDISSVLEEPVSSFLTDLDFTVFKDDNTVLPPKTKTCIVECIFCVLYCLSWKLCFRAWPWTSMKVVLQSLIMNFNESCASEPDLELQWKLCFKSWSWTSMKVVLQILILNFIMWTLLQNWCMCSEQTQTFHCSLCLNFLHLPARKPNLEKCSSYLNKFFHNFHFSESSIIYPGLRASGLAPRLALAF